MAPDQTYNMLGQRFPVPLITRWSSLYDATVRLLTEKDRLDDVLEKLKFAKLKSTEWTFLEEYCRVMTPVATALDKLQGEKNCFLCK